MTTPDLVADRLAFLDLIADGIAVTVIRDNINGGHPPFLIPTELLAHPLPPDGVPYTNNEVEHVITRIMETMLLLRERLDVNHLDLTIDGDRI